MHWYYRGGLELLELKTGKTVHVLLPKVAEGVFDVVTMFTKTDRHVIYYHTGQIHFLNFPTLCPSFIFLYHRRSRVVYINSLYH